MTADPGATPFPERYAELYPPPLRDPDPVVDEWWRWGDVAVHLNRVRASAAPFVVVLVHGIGGYGRLFTPFASLIGTERAEFVAPDLPGYGRTRPDGPITYAMWVRCVADLVRAERARSGRPVVLFGASMGGMIAYEAAAAVGAAGVVATCLLDPRDRAVRRATARFPALGQFAPSVLTAFRGVTDRLRLPVRWLTRMSAMSHDPRLNALVASDPSGGGNTISMGFLRTFLTSVPAVEPERFDVCPVLLAHPGADDWTPVELSRPFFDRIAAPTDLVLLGNCGHLPVEQPGLDQLRDAATRFLDGLGR